MAICSGYPGIQHLDKSIFYSQSGEVSCCKQQASSHAGGAGGGRDGPEPTAAGTQTQQWEPYQEDTPVELLPKNDKVESTNPHPISWGEDKHVWVKVKPSNTPHRYLLLVHIQSLPSFSNLSVHHFQPACSSCALSYSFFSGFPFLCVCVDSSFSFILLSHEAVFLQAAFLT